MQKCRLTEIFPLISMSNIWDQYPVLSYPESPQVASSGMVTAVDCFMAGIQFAS